MSSRSTLEPRALRRSGFTFGLFLAAVFVTALPHRVDAASVRPSTDRPPVPTQRTGSGPSSPFLICADQTYALCAAASCYVYNGVAYCKCDVEQGDSISLAFEVDGQDVCDVNANGTSNGYMVSTFSLPDSVLKSKGDMALYTCPGGSDGAYGQCDGGLCFTSTEGVPSFPGFGQPLAADEIICSCPITVQKENSAIGYQIAGPYPCEESFFENCNSDVTSDKTGSAIPVGAPVGSARFLALMLYGPPLPLINECAPQSNGN